MSVEGHPFVAAGSDPESFGFALIPFLAEFVTGRADVTQEDADAWVAEQQELAERGELYSAITQFCFTATGPA